MRCLTDTEIERIAADQAAAPSHLTECPACRARLEAARHDSRLVADLRELYRTRQAIKPLVDRMLDE